MRIHAAQEKKPEEHPLIYAKLYGRTYTEEDLIK